MASEDKAVRRTVVAGNWKMNGTAASIAALLDGFEGKLGGRSADVVLFPPSPYLASVVLRARSLGVAVGAQTIHAEPRGAFTGEVAAEMVQDLGAAYVLVGHSERRHAFGETDAVISAKFGAARRAGLTPVLCVGETLGEREAGDALRVVQRQLGVVLREHGVDALRDAIVAYEPVWAIGTGLTATPADAQKMHLELRAFVAASNPAVAGELRVLYGGSVTQVNARALMNERDVDGVLVGGASLEARQFVEIYNSV